ncbi:hypothetical protein ARMGADRAFT_1019507 [Armillaria gallica]|uniref:Uncharacterized protein n=1 Tax=Armillaria gallica TaxID=47427 RepID=A0A2H3CU78_ARMGA|nr:hypothetical protein ARMGADRAFT_1019507 [Armillaria gallica]
MFITFPFLENHQFTHSNRLFELTGVMVFYPLLVPSLFDLQDLSRSFSDTEIVEQDEIVW